MSQNFALQIVSPTGAVFDSAVVMAEIPGADGDFGVLFGHAPLFSMLRPGVITLHLATNDKLRYFATSGYADVSPNGCVILSEHVQDLSQISLAEAQAAVSATEKALAEAASATQQQNAHKRLAAAKALLAAVHG